MSTYICVGVRVRMHPQSGVQAEGGDAVEALISSICIKHRWLKSSLKYRLKETTYAGRSRKEEIVVIIKPNISACHVMQSKARQSKAKQGKARQSKAKQGKARQSKAKQGINFQTRYPVHNLEHM
jgi:hypothetical protein